MNPGQARPFLRSAFRMGGGLFIWAAHFLFSYVLAAMACELGFSAARVGGMPAVTLAVAAVSLVAAAVCAWLLHRARLAPHLPEADGPDHFVNRVAAAVAVIALIGIAGTAAVGLMPLQCEIPAVSADT